MATVILTDSQFYDQHGIHVVGEIKFSMNFYHYFTLRRLEEMLNKNELAFVYPALWDDPFETLFLETDYSALNGYKHGKIFCFCVRNSTDNEEASWKVYSNGGDPLIRVCFDLRKLSPFIADFAKKQKCKVYYSQIEYILSDDKIKEITNGKGWLKEYLANFDEEKYIRLMSLKRPAFEYEKEYRLFIVPQEGSPLLDSEDDVIKVPIDASVYSEFTIAPRERIKKSEEKELLSSIKKSAYKLKVKIITEFIKSKVADAEVNNSKLYENAEKISRIRIKKSQV